MLLYKIHVINPRMPKGGGVDATPPVGFLTIIFFGITIKPIAFGYLFPQINDVF
jgi:hypothetical protein